MTSTTTTTTTIKPRHIPHCIRRCTHEDTKKRALKVFGNPNSTKQERDYNAFLCIDYEKRKKDKETFTKNVEFRAVIKDYVYCNLDLYNTG